MSKTTVRLGGSNFFLNGKIGHKEFRKGETPNTNNEKKCSNTSHT
jgi:hypothetical protein